MLAGAAGRFMVGRTASAWSHGEQKVQSKMSLGDFPRTGRGRNVAICGAFFLGAVTVVLEV